MIVRGTNRIDRIRIKQNRRKVTVYEYKRDDAFFDDRGGTPIYTTDRRVTSIDVALAAGGDTVHNNTDIPSVMRGGQGDDVIIGGDSNDTLFGDDGADHIYGGPGRDRVNGGRGTGRGDGKKDFLYGGDDQGDRVEGGNNDHKDRAGRNAPKSDPRRAGQARR